MSSLGDLINSKVKDLQDSRPEVDKEDPEYQDNKNHVFVKIMKILGYTPSSDDEN